MRKTNCPFKLGDAVVYQAPNGDSISATITNVSASEVYITWYPEYARAYTVMVERKLWSLLTPFGSAKFLAI